MTCRLIIQGVLRASRLSFARHPHQTALQLTSRPTVCLHNHLSLATKPFSTESSPPRRRRRRTSPSSTSINDSSSDEPSILHTSDDTSPFTPLNPITGQPLTSTEYLSLTTLSPWVPCPDIVIKRVLEIASASSSDRHVDLGCGDGRWNFAAVSSPHFVERSVGVDVDETVLERARGRMGRRFVPKWNGGSGAAALVSNDDDTGGGKSNDGEKSELDKLEFLQADLVQVIQREKKRYQQKLRDGVTRSNNQNNATSTPNESSTDDNIRLDEIHSKIASSTLITMYFVHSSLTQLKPYLSSIFGGKDNARIVTIGYEMPDWEPSWAERVLDLTVFRYDMKGVDCHPVEWGLDYIVDDGVGGVNDKNAVLLDNNRDDSSIHEENDELSPSILQRRQEELDLLNSNLRIHHDEELDDIASFRTKRMALHHSTLELPEEWEEDWDFDEDEDYDAGESTSGSGTSRMMEKNVKGEGRKSLLAGLDIGLDGGEKNKKEKSKPVWRKPE